MTPERRRLRVAVVGCGAITRMYHLPILAGHDGVEVVALVDRHLASARELAAAYGVGAALPDASDLSSIALDAVIVAVPPAFHVPIAMPLAERGVHVLVEKPMAVTAAEAQDLVRAAREHGSCLTVGQFRRMLPATRLLRSLIGSALAGAPLRFDVEEGYVLDWPSMTLGGMSRALAGGGVLLDTGSHPVDQILSCLPGRVELVDYADDSLGGIESNCRLRFEIETRWRRVPGTVTLSRTHALRNTLRIECERAVLELDTSERRGVRIIHAGEPAADPTLGDALLRAEWRQPYPDDRYAPYRAQLDDWIDAITDHRQPALSGESVLPMIRLFADAYDSRQPLGQPWVPFPVPPASSAGRVLVTGATGFIGGRLVEALHLHGGWTPRALVHNPGSASRLARLPVEMIQGDLKSADDVRRAVDGCDAVVHCAYGTAWGDRADLFAVTVNGTRRLADEAHAQGCRRFVHLSTTAIHGLDVAGAIDEDTAVRPGTDTYAVTKALAEREIARARVGSVVLRLPNVYGPFSEPFTRRPARHLLAGLPVLVGDGSQPSNTIYVDNVVGAILSALRVPGIDGQTFVLADEEPLTWRQLFEAYAAALGVRPVSVSVDEYEAMLAASRAPRRQPWLRRWADAALDIATSHEAMGLAKKILATDPIGTFPRRLINRSPRFKEALRRLVGDNQPEIYRVERTPGGPGVPLQLLQVYAITAGVNISKARSRLGYESLMDRGRALSTTSDWLQDAFRCAHGARSVVVNA